MKINILVKLRSKVSRLEKVEDLLWTQDCYMAYITSPPIDGKANEEIIRLVSDYFHIRQNQVQIKSGHTGKQKIIDINS